MPVKPNDKKKYKNALIKYYGKKNYEEAAKPKKLNVKRSAVANAALGGATAYLATSGLKSAGLKGALIGAAALGLGAYGAHLAKKQNAQKKKSIEQVIKENLGGHELSQMQDHLKLKSKLGMKQKFESNAPGQWITTRGGKRIFIKAKRGISQKLGKK